MSTMTLTFTQHTWRAMQRVAGTSALDLTLISLKITCTALRQLCGVTQCRERRLESAAVRALPRSKTVCRRGWSHGAHAGSSCRKPSGDYLPSRPRCRAGPRPSRRRRRRRRVGAVLRRAVRQRRGRRHPARQRPPPSHSERCRSRSSWLRAEWDGPGCQRHTANSAR